ncbi:hypothetical protein RvY_08145 [Ramazzottius varieornatus]|uniref:Tudor domain-containing protein n=1 Tax=Ramazzottius varieornatus TaxID=947166 RepID=A0A1D1V4Q9_RAMVA|nr:hypothetical protein RvY_08145 [Ramazzottius varieornatus]
MKDLVCAMATLFKERYGGDFARPKGLLLPPDITQPKEDRPPIVLHRPQSQTTTPTNELVPGLRSIRIFAAQKGKVVRLVGPDSLIQEQLVMIEQQLKGRVTVVPDTPARPYQAETPKKDSSSKSSPMDEVVKASASSSIRCPSTPFSLQKKQDNSSVSVRDLEEKWDDNFSIAASETTDRDHYNLETLLRTDSMPMLQTGYHIKSGELGLPRDTFPGDTIAGSICAVMDPEVLFVYEASDKQTQNLHFALKKELSDPRIEELQRYREPPPLDTVVLARFSRDCKWYRAAVVDVDKSGQSVYVFYVDWGNHESLPLDEVRPLPASLAQFPQAIFMVCVQGLATPSDGYFPAKVFAAHDALVSKKCQVEVKEVEDEGVVGEVLVLDKATGSEKSVVELYEELSIATPVRKRMIGAPKPKKLPMKYTMIPRALRINT